MEEQFDVVNEQDEAIGQAARSLVHAQGVWHRGAHVFLFTDAGKLIVQKRSASRGQYPSLWDGSLSEHVKAGETYVEAAQRGLEEELGVRRVSLQPLFKFRMNYGPNDNEISLLFRGDAELGHVHFDPEEIAQVAEIEIETLRRQIHHEPRAFCGWFIAMLDEHLGRPSSLDVLQDWRGARPLQVARGSGRG